MPPNQEQEHLLNSTVDAQAGAERAVVVATVPPPAPVAVAATHRVADGNRQAQGEGRRRNAGAPLAPPTMQPSLDNAEPRLQERAEHEAPIPQTRRGRDRSASPRRGPLVREERDRVDDGRDRY